MGNCVTDKSLLPCILQILPPGMGESAWIRLEEQLAQRSAPQGDAGSAQHDALPRQSARQHAALPWESGQVRQKERPAEGDRVKLIDVNSCIFFDRCGRDNYGMRDNSEMVVSDVCLKGEKKRHHHHHHKSSSRNGDYRDRDQSAGRRDHHRHSGSGGGGGGGHYWPTMIITISMEQ